MMTALWATMLAEPRWLVIIGLGSDVVGAVLVAWTAWARVVVVVYFDRDATDDPKALNRRRWAVIAGASLLVAGFGLQGIAAAMQMGQGHPGYWTI